MCYNNILHYNRFYYGGILRFFKGRFVKTHQKPLFYKRFLYFSPSGLVGENGKIVNFKEWSDSIYA